jgi:integrase/recombinase XerD
MKFFKYFPKKNGPRQKDVLRERFKNFVLELRVRNFSNQTIDAYLHYNGKFLDFIKKEQRSINSKDIKAYLNYLVLNGAGPRTVNMAINSLKCYYGSYLGKRLFTNIKRSKIPKDFDPVISKEQVKLMIENTKFLKHRLLIELLYSSGMRVGECVKVRVDDVDYNDRIVFIKKGKGAKDRFTIISNRFIKDLKKYLNSREKQSVYLFDNGFDHISIRTAEEVVKLAAKRAGIKKRVYPHLLRACFATHLLGNKVPMEKIQKLMGHSDIKTTQGYARLNTEEFKKIKSPLDV